MAEGNKDVVYFGRTDFRGASRLFGIKRADRRQHMYVIGKSGTGKTTLIKNMAIQDIANGDGLCVVDPHGEYVEEILEKIPHSRLQDVVYFNPADPDFHIGFNILELPDPKYKHLVASGLMGIFTKIWAGVWSARMEYILNNCVLALMDTPNTTLLGITRLLVDKEYRQAIVANIKDPVVRGFWVNEYEQWRDQFRNEAIVPIQNKVGQFLSSAIVRNIVGQAKSTISIDEIMNTKKIFLVNVSKGRIGEDNSRLLGAMIITKLQLHAMERVRIKDENMRPDFYLYVDEFQNFATDSFANILSEARKYRLDLIMAHQYIGQLTDDQSTKVRDAVFGNVGTMITFRVGAADAEFIEKEYAPEFDVQDLVNLPNRHIYLKLMVDGVASRPFSASTLPPFSPAEGCSTVEEIIAESRKRYAKPRELVESEIARWSGMGGSETNNEIADRVAGMENGANGGPAVDGLAKRPMRPSGYRNTDALATLGIEFGETPQSNRPASPRGASAPYRLPTATPAGESAATVSTRESTAAAPSSHAAGTTPHTGGASAPHRPSGSATPPAGRKLLVKRERSHGQAAEKKDSTPPRRESERTMSLADLAKFAESHTAKKDNPSARKSGPGVEDLQKSIRAALKQVPHNENGKSDI
jgi:hypothetical protein